MLNIFGNIIGSKITTPNSTSLSSNIRNISTSFKNIQRIGTPVSISASPSGGGGVSEWFWVIRDSGHEDALGNFVDMSFSQNPTFNLPNPGYYDIYLVAKNSVSTYKQLFRRAFFNWYPKFTEGQADEVVDLAALNGSGFFHDYLMTARPGYKLGIKGTGTLNSFNTMDLRGAAGWPNHVRVQTLGDNVVINGAAGFPHLMRIEGTDANVNGGTRFVVFDCFNSDGTNGFTVNGPTSVGGGTQVFRVLGGGYTDVHILGVNINSNNAVGAINAAAFSAVPTVSSTWQASTWAVDNFTLYRCTINQAGDEAVYIGETSDDPSYFANNGFIPPKYRKMVVARNILTNAGRDAYQPGGAFKFAFHNNQCNGFGTKTNAGHESGVSKNGGSTGWVMWNYFNNGEMFANDQSGRTPWDILGGETAINNQMYYWSNVFNNGSYSTGGGSEPYVMSIQTFIGGGSATAYNPAIFHNTIVTDKEIAIFYPVANAFTQTKFTFANNLLIKKSGGVSGNTDVGTKEEMIYDVGTFLQATLMATGNIAALTGEQVIDGTLSSNSVVFLNNQSTASQNGVWITGAGAWTRHTSADSSGEVQYLQVRVTAGATNANTYWYQTTVTPTINVNNLVFAKKFQNTVINNLVRANGSQSDVLFTKYTNPLSSDNNLKPSSFSSVAFAGSPTDIAARHPEIDPYLLVDYNGYPLLATGFPYAFGAYSNYEQRGVVNDYDTVAATLSTPVTAGSINNFGFTISYEANKEGYLYYVVVTDGSAAPSQAQIIAGLNGSGTSAIVSGRILDAGTAGTAVITTLTGGTAYDIYSVFVTKYNVRTNGTKVDVSTTSDVTAPTLSSFAIPNANRDRVTFNSSEPIVTNTVVGFTISGSHTISSIFINGANTTGHYFQLSVPFVQTDFGTAFTVAYTAGGTPAIEDLSGNDLANFGATAITNNIAAGPLTDVTIENSQAGSLAGSPPAWTSSGVGGFETHQLIAANQAGEIRFKYSSTLGTSNDSEVGFILDSSNINYTQGQLLINIRFETNANTGAYHAASFDNSIGGLQVTSNIFRTRRDLSNNGFAEYSVDSGANWLTLKSYGAISSAAIRGAVHTPNASARNIPSIQIQSDKGLT